MDQQTDGLMNKHTSPETDKWMREVVKERQNAAAHLLMPPFVRRARPSVLDIFILEPLLSACWDTVKGGFHSTKHLGPWGDPSSEITSTCSTPVTARPS